jgi:hypothetical protein
MHPVTLCVTLAPYGTRSVQGGIPTQSVGTNTLTLRMDHT